MSVGSANCSLYVTHVAPQTTESDLKSLFETYGTVEHCRLSAHSKHPAGLLYGFVRYSTIDEANEAIKNLHGYNLGGWQLEVKFEKSAAKTDKVPDRKAGDTAQRRGPQSSALPTPDQTKRKDTLYVNNIPKTWGAEDLKCLFGLAGEVSSCFMLQARNTSIETCSAMVKMGSTEAAANAIEMLNNKQPPGSGHLLGVKFAEAQEDRQRDAKDKPSHSASQRYTPYDAKDRPNHSSNDTTHVKVEHAVQDVPFPGLQQNFPSSFSLQASSFQQSLPLQYGDQNASLNMGQVPGLSPGLGAQFTLLPFPGALSNPFMTTLNLQGGFGGSVTAGQPGAQQDPSQNQTMQQAYTNVGQLVPQIPQQLLTFHQQTAGEDFTEPPSASNTDQPLSTIYISGLPFDVDELMLYKRFAPFGAILSVKVLIDKRTNTPTGAGFVNYTTQAAAEAAHAAMDKVKIADRVELNIVLQAPRVGRNK